MSYTSPRRPGEPDIPAFRWVPGTPDVNGSPNGCKGCAFRRQLAIRCSRIPCHIPAHRGLVAQLIPE